MAGGPTELRLLVAFEEKYRAFQGAISSAIQVLRPSVRVETSGIEILTEELARFAPQAVICSLPEGSDLAGRVAWIELPPEPDRAARVRLGDRRFEMDNPSLESVLEVVDKAELLLRNNSNLFLR